MKKRIQMVRRLWPIRSLKASIALLCGLFLVTFTALLGYGLLQARQRYLDQAMASAEGLASTYKAYTEKAVNEIDFSLLLVQGYARQLGVVGPRLMQSVAPALELRRLHTPYVSNLMIADGHGVILSATSDAAAMVGTRAAAEREFLKAHRDGRDAGFFVGPVITSKLHPGQLRFTLSRRLEGPRGEFLGVVVAFVDAGRLAQDYARQMDAQAISVTLMRIDGMVLSRTPFVQDQVGMVLPSFARYNGDPPSRSSFVLKSQIDQVTRLIAQRRFDGMPLLIAVTELQDVALKRWIAALPLALGIWALVAFTTLALGALVVYQQGRREQAQRQLSESLEAFNEAQRMARVGSVDHDLVTGEQRWSDEMFRLLEIDRNRADLSVDMRHDRVHPEDRELVGHAIGQSRALKLPYQVTYRLQMPGGRIKWISESCAIRYDGASNPVREVIMLQDVTVSRQAEETLVRLRAELDARDGRGQRDPFSA